MMMMSQAPPPPPRNPIVKYFCPHLQVEVVGVLRRCGLYYYYCFDYTDKTFKPLECLGCQPETKERDLFPLYAEFSEDLDEYVFFAFNNLSLKTEKFIFDHGTGGFEEVLQPQMVHDTQKPLANIMCVVEGTNQYGDVIIQRDIASQTFHKSRAYNGQFITLPPVRVRTKMFEDLDNFPVRPDEADSFRCPFPIPKNTLTMILQTCPRFPGVNMVCVRQKDGSYLRFYSSDQTGDFYPVTCPVCVGPLSEKSLLPLYVAYSKEIGEQVIFMNNTQNFNVEKYVFCKEKLGFKQVEAKDVKYDQRLISYLNVVLRVPTKDGFIYLSKSPDGSVEKYICMDNGTQNKITPMEVKTLAIQKKDSEQMRNLLKNFCALMYDKLAVGQQLQQSLQKLEQGETSASNTVDPSLIKATSDSEDSEVDDESDSDSNADSDDAVDGSIEKNESDAEDSDDSDLEDYDTCADEDSDETIRAV